MSYSIDVNGNDNQPEWGYCTVAGCKEAAFPIWFSGGEPDDPDLYLCPTHIGARILHEETARTAYQELATRAEANNAALRQAIQAYRNARELLMRDPEQFSDAECLAIIREKQAADTAIAAMLITEHPGAALLAELEAARTIVATLRQHRDAGGEVWGSIDRDFAAYDAAVKARTE
jgi:hypothetical protein